MFAMLTAIHFYLYDNADHALFAKVLYAIQIMFYPLQPSEKATPCGLTNNLRPKKHNFEITIHVAFIQLQHLETVYNVA